MSKVDDVDDFLMKSMKEIKEHRTKAEVADSEAHFGNHVVATLRRVQPRQQALVKLQIDQILFNAEFPCEPSYHSNMSLEPTYYSNTYQSHNP